MATAPILAGDIKLLASKVMDDVPNGGGGPTGTVIPDGASNAVFGDVTERARAGGSVSIRQLHLAVQTPNTAAYMDPSIIVSQVPNDANVSITLAKCGMFAKRTEIASTIENYLIQGPEWGGYLLENHVAGQRSIQLLQRPGTPTPPIGRTLVLIANEGLPGEYRQFVRVTRVEVEQRTFTYSTGGGFADYLADVVVCDLTDALRSNFAGSPPSRVFVRATGKTVVRDTTVADASVFYGASPLTALASVGDSTLRVSSVYTQLVPSARTEVVALDQKPAAQRTLTLATAPRLVEVATTPHTMRIRVGQENRGFAWVQMLKPRPAPGTLVVSYMALGNWYTLSDDGAGGFTGSGVGQVIYSTGSLSVTLPAMPDAGSSIIFQWGENTAYTSRAGQAGFRAPEFAWALAHQGVKPGTVIVKWLSGGVLQTATDNSVGVLVSTAGTGDIDYATGKVYLRPTAMLDAGGEFATDYEYQSVITQNFHVPAVDAGGFASLTLSETPAAKSVTVRWVTVRNVSASTGVSTLVSSAGESTIGSGTGSGSGSGGGAAVVNPATSANTFLRIWRNGVETEVAKAGDALSLKLQCANPQTPGEYTWAIEAWHNGVAQAATAILQGGATGGTLTVATSGEPVADTSKPTGFGDINVTIAALAPDCLVQFVVNNQSGTQIAVAHVRLDGAGGVIVEPPPTPPPPASVSPNHDAVPQEGMGAGGTDDAGRYIFVALPVVIDPVYGPSYDPPASVGERWTVAEIASRSKQLMSVKGVLTTYQIWG